MKNEKIYGAMVRLNESTYFELRKIALENRRTFSSFTRELLEKYVAECGYKPRGRSNGVSAAV